MNNLKWKQTQVPRDEQVQAPPSQKAKGPDQEQRVVVETQELALAPQKVMGKTPLGWPLQMMLKQLYWRKTSAWEDAAIGNTETQPEMLATTFCDDEWTGKNTADSISDGVTDMVGDNCHPSIPLEMLM